MLPGVRPTGRQLGVGAYGSVEELEVNGVVCAGKRLHETLLEQGNAGVAHIARKYLMECQVTGENVFLYTIVLKIIKYNLMPYCR